MVLDLIRLNCSRLLRRQRKCCIGEVGKMYPMLSEQSTCRLELNEKDP